MTDWFERVMWGFLAIVVVIGSGSLIVFMLWSVAQGAMENPAVAKKVAVASVGIFAASAVVGTLLDRAGLLPISEGSS